MIPFDELSSFSRRFAERLFTVHPQWRELADIPHGEGWDTGVLAVTVVSPIGRELSVDTNGGEITVGFGEHGWHAHYWAWDDVDEETVFERAITEIDAILSEELAILTRYEDGRIRSSETFWRDENVQFKTAERVEVVSWLGTRDATLFPA